MLEDVRASIMPDNPDENTLFTAAADYAATLGFVLACVSKEFQQDKGGYAFHLLSRDHGYFLVQLRVTTGRPTRSRPIYTWWRMTARPSATITSIPRCLTPRPTPHLIPALTSPPSP